MASTLIVIGFFLLLAGIVLRTIINDALQRCTCYRHASSARPRVGRAVSATLPKAVHSFGDALAADQRNRAAAGRTRRGVLALMHQRAGATALAVTLVSFHGKGLGIPGGIDMPTIFASAVFAPVSRSR